MVATLEELKKQSAEDLKINIDEIIEASANNCVLHNKYLSLLVDEKFRYKKLTLDMYKLRKARYRYYMGYEEEVPDEVLSDRGIKYHLEGDDEILELQKRIIVTEEKIRFLTETLSSIVSRGFNIKNIIEQRKIDLGIN